MEALSDTVWDVVLSGTGLPQSLLALALSRSGKKVLHIDKNDYYGGLEAALSLQEAETWAENVGKHIEQSPFRNVQVRNLEQRRNDGGENTNAPKLGFSRAYSLSLSPQLIYTRSNLLPALVSSKVYRQLEFLAVGSWWLYDIYKKGNAENEEASEAAENHTRGGLRKIPGGREDVFADKNIDRRSMMPLMKFLKIAADPEAHISILEEWGQTPFPNFLESQFKIPPEFQELLFTLTMSPNFSGKTLTSYALPRIHRHLTSIGMFGPGFGSVIPKWGGLAEISQVACRACAVGGGVYVLKKGFEDDNGKDRQASETGGIHIDPDTRLLHLTLEGGESLRCHWLAGSQWDLPLHFQEKTVNHNLSVRVSRSITIISGLLQQLFPPPAEGAPPPAGAVAVFPVRTLQDNSVQARPQTFKSNAPSVYLMIRSSDTGECPTGQCVIYGHVYHHNVVGAELLLQTAVEQLLAKVNEDPTPTVLWSLHFDQQHAPSSSSDERKPEIDIKSFLNGHVLQLPDLKPGLTLEDNLLKEVRVTYERIMGDGNGFLVFEDREGMGDEGEGSGEGDM